MQDVNPLPAASWTGADTNLELIQIIEQHINFSADLGPRNEAGQAEYHRHLGIPTHVPILLVPVKNQLVASYSAVALRYNYHARMHHGS